MVYFFYGAETFQLKRKINSEINRYQAKHKSGLNFGRFNFILEQGFDDFKNFIESYSMFSEKKLAIIEELFEATPSTQTNFINNLETSKILKDEERFDHRAGVKAQR